MRRFEITVSYEDDFFQESQETGIIEIDNHLIEMVDDEWRSVLYDLKTPEDIAAHLGYNFFVNGIRSLSRLDGWADQPDTMFKIIKDVNIGYDMVKSVRELK